jgi:hypothetical protein
MYLDDIEVFRTSTAEPTSNGIIWTYTKDMSAYLALFKAPHKIIFDLGNILDDTYTGSWNTTLTASFFVAENTIKPADIVLPISTQKSNTNQPSAFIVPESKALATLQLPTNAKRAVFSISACGQAAEEFWWSNVLSSDTRVFGNESVLYGHSPFRELQLFIDGNMAGVAWPFPVIFTGGIVPGFWRPIVGIGTSSPCIYTSKVYTDVFRQSDAFDLREDEIDISPFIPVLNDGKPHTFEIRVIGFDDDGQGNGVFTENIESNWVVTGKVFIWLDSSTDCPTTGTIPIIYAPAPSVHLQSTTKRNLNGTTDSLEYSIKLSREIYIESSMNTSEGSNTVFWKQNLTFSNAGTLSNKGNDQVMRQTTSGTSSSSGYLRSFDYPMWVISSYSAPPNGNTTISGKMGRGKTVEQRGDLAFLNDWRTFDYNRSPSPLHNLSFSGSHTMNWQNGTASYLSVPGQKKSYGSGSTTQLFVLRGTAQQPISVVQDGTNRASPLGRADEELYQRHILAANDSIVYDDERFSGQRAQRTLLNVPSQRMPTNELHEYASRGVRALLGRGPR